MTKPGVGKNLMRLMFMAGGAVVGGLILYRYVQRQTRNGVQKVRLNGRGSGGSGNVIGGSKVPRDELLQDLNPRQRGILERFERFGHIRMKALSEELKDVSERTLRRDLERLEKAGLIEQVGKTKDSLYRRV